MGYNQKVIDVSYHDGVIDWEKVKAAGYHAIIRCGYGDNLKSQDDKQWVRNYTECERLGIPYGAYLYSYAKTDAEIASEIEHVRRLVTGRKLSYPVYFDSEEPGTEHVADRYAQRFCAAVEGMGFWAGIYTGMYWINNYMPTAKNGRYTLWIARYNTVPPEIGCSYDIWQYGGGRVPGIGPDCDLNHCYKDFPALIRGGITETEDHSKDTADKPKKTTDQLAREVIAGDWGSGTERKNRITAAGYNYNVVQARVNQYYSTAQKVIDGLYGNGSARRKRLAQEGYDYGTVQKIVNDTMEG